MSQRRLTMAARRVDDAWWLAGGAPEPVAAYQPIGAASLEASYLRVAGTGGNANLDPAVVGSGVAPTWASATGWGSAGTAWLNTGLFGGPNLTTLIRFSEVTSTSRIIIGHVDSANPAARFDIRPNWSNGRLYIWSNGSIVIAGAVEAGVMGLAGNQAYLNGVADGVAITGTYSGTSTRPIYIFVLNNNGNPAFFTPGNIQAVAIYDTTLTAPQVAAVSAAMAAL